jgi:hypothetical protein
VTRPGGAAKETEPLQLAPARRSTLKPHLLGVILTPVPHERQARVDDEGLAVALQHLTALAHPADRLPAVRRGRKNAPEPLAVRGLLSGRMNIGCVPL